MIVCWGNTVPCTGCQPTPQLRGVYFTSSMNVAGDQTHMLNWLESYDIDSVPWGSWAYGQFSSYTEIEPDTVVVAGSPPPNVWGTFNFLQGCSGSGPPCAIANTSSPGASIAQAYLPTPTPYYIVAVGDAGPCDSGAADVLAHGCIYPQQSSGDYPMIVNIPVPDNNLDNLAVTVNGVFVYGYQIGLINSSASYANNMLGLAWVSEPDLDGTAADYGVNEFGPNWATSILIPCYGTIGNDHDPFTGIFEPP